MPRCGRTNGRASSSRRCSARPWVSSGWGRSGRAWPPWARPSAWRCWAGRPPAIPRVFARPGPLPPPRRRSSRADVISLNMRLGSETRGFLGRKELAQMKPTAILINTGRGALVEKNALIAALAERKIMGAGLDVFHQEPLALDDPILALPNVILSPHNAGQTPEVIRDGLLRAVENVEHFLQGKPRDVVVAPVR